MPTRALWCPSLSEWRTLLEVFMTTKNVLRPSLVWLSWLGFVPQIERSLVRFQERAHTWVAGSVPVQGAYKRQLIDVSLTH